MKPMPEATKFFNSVFLDELFLPVECCTPYAMPFEDHMSHSALGGQGEFRKENQDNWSRQKLWELERRRSEGRDRCKMYRLR